MKLAWIVLLTLFLVHAQPLPQKTLIHRDAEKFWAVQEVKEVTFVYSERYSDGSGSDWDFSFTTITITPTTITLSGSGFGYGKTVAVAEAELADKLKDIFKTRIGRFLMVAVEPPVSAQRLLKVLAICQPELDGGFLFAQK